MLSMTDDEDKKRLQKERVWIVETTNKRFGLKLRRFPSDVNVGVVKKTLKLKMKISHGKAFYLPGWLLIHASRYIHIIYQYP